MTKNISSLILGEGLRSLDKVHTPTNIRTINSFHHSEKNKK